MQLFALHRASQGMTNAIAGCMVKTEAPDGAFAEESMNTNGLGSVPHISVSALDAFAAGMQAIAHNVANVNTAGFQPQTVYYSSLPPHMGVQLGHVSGPEPEALTAQMPEQPTGVLPTPHEPASFMPPEWIRPSQTSLEREMTNMIAVQRAYEANVAPIRTWDEMTGTLVNLKA